MFAQRQASKDWACFPRKKKKLSQSASLAGKNEILRKKKEAKNICGGNTKHILDYFYSTFTISIRKMLLITSLNDIGTKKMQHLLQKQTY